jgi:hypothetical protein
MWTTSPTSTAFVEAFGAFPRGVTVRRAILPTPVVGVLGVIGPTRMAYERVIPIVDMTAKLLGAALNSRR